MSDITYWCMSASKPFFTVAQCCCPRGKSLSLSSRTNLQVLVLSLGLKSLSVSLKYLSLSSCHKSSESNTADALSAVLDSLDLWHEDKDKYLRLTDKDLSPRERTRTFVICPISAMVSTNFFRLNTVKLETKCFETWIQCCCPWVTMILGLDLSLTKDQCWVTALALNLRV